jgi:hypothetical protein
MGTSVGPQVYFQSFTTFQHLSLSKFEETKLITHDFNSSYPLVRAPVCLIGTNVVPSVYSEQQEAQATRTER